MPDLCYGCLTQCCWSEGENQDPFRRLTVPSLPHSRRALWFFEPELAAINLQVLGPLPPSVANMATKLQSKYFTGTK